MSATALPRTRRRPRRPNWTARLRRISQAVFVGLILAMSVRHNLVEGSGQTASIDALCPFGAVETLWRFITTGQFVPKTHLSNLILGAGLLIGIVPVSYTHLWVIRSPFIVHRSSLSTPRPCPLSSSASLSASPPASVRGR